MIEFLNNKKKKSGFVSLLTTTTLGGIIFIISLATTYLVFLVKSKSFKQPKRFKGLLRGLFRP